MIKEYIFLTILGFAVGIPFEFSTKKFFVGVEYDKSLPMEGGSEMFRHRNNFDPFYVTITTSAKRGFVIAYLEVTATTDQRGDVEFCLLHGQAGSQTMVFQLTSNNTDFLSYTYKTFGIREENYNKVTSPSNDSDGCTYIDGELHNHSNK